MEGEEEKGTKKDVKCFRYMFKFPMMSEIIRTANMPIKVNFKTDESKFSSSVRPAAFQVLNKSVRPGLASGRDKSAHFFSQDTAAQAG